MVLSARYCSCRARVSLPHGSEGDLQPYLADISLGRAAGHSLSSRIGPGMDVVRHHADIGLRVPVQADRHALMKPALDVAAREVDDGVAGGHLEYANSAVRDALAAFRLYPREHADLGRYVRVERVARRLAVDHPSCLQVSALEGNVATCHAIDLCRDVFGLHPEWAICPSEFEAEAADRLRADRARVDERGREQEAFRVRGEGDIRPGLIERAIAAGHAEMEDLV